VREERGPIIALSHDLAALAQITGRPDAARPESIPDRPPLHPAPVHHLDFGMSPASDRPDRPLGRPNETMLEKTLAIFPRQNPRGALPGVGRSCRLLRFPFRSARPNRRFKAKLLFQLLNLSIVPSPFRYLLCLDYTPLLRDPDLFRAV